MRLRSGLILLLVALFAAALAGCGGGSATQTASLGVFPIASDLKVGENRLPFALIDKDGKYLVVRPAAVRVNYRPQDGGQARRAAAATYRQWPGGRGTYVTTAVFDVPGIWLMDVTIDGFQGTYSAGLQVRQEALTPAVGDPAPRTPTRVATAGQDLSEITTAVDPDPGLYALSLADAIATGKPVVVTFSTPLYCATATCGPQLDEILELRKRFGDRANFIHVEIYENPAEIQGDLTKGRIADAVKQWGLPSEPWTFVINGAGVVAAKFEAYATASEIAPALEAALALAGG